MASASRENLKAALGNAVSTTGTAVVGTTEVAKIATEKAFAITKSAVGAVGVLGEGTVKAAEQIGTTALQTGADVGANALAASGTIVNAATQATADIASTTLETASSTVNVTTEKVGEALQAGVTLAGNTVTRAVKGIDNIGEIISGRGALTIKSVLQKQEAKSAAIDSRDAADKKTELLNVFAIVKTQVSSALSTLHGVQKTALAGKINIYKRAKCGFFKRITGYCDTTNISNDMKKVEFFLSDFKSKLDAASESAKVSITTATGDTQLAFQSAEIKYNETVAAAVNEFISSYKTIVEKYDSLTKVALGIAGGRKRKTRKRKSNKRKTIRRRK
jgi:hypothetical protein